jgi:predicted nuclease with RNAse H fold
MIMVGIDLGSQLAGTTALAVLDGDEVVIRQSEKGKSADDFIQNQLKELSVGSLVGIDAPLSLPEVYIKEALDLTEEPDFHYRECDKKVKAMSPMFLGGLTARAMKLAHHLQQKGLKIFEIYPKMVFQNSIQNREGYKKKWNRNLAEEWLSELEAKHGFKLQSGLENWHQFDAVLALTATLRIYSGEAEKVGDENEGVIYF